MYVPLWHSQATVATQTCHRNGARPCSCHQTEIDIHSFVHHQNHSTNEAEYIESCTEAKLLGSPASGELASYRMSYHLPPPTTDREFAILILTKDVSPPEGPRKMQVVTVPTEHPDAPQRKGFVRGKYASVEEVEELEGGGVEWR